MKPLLEIRTIPMSVEYKINKARYEIINTDASVEITHNKSGIKMQMKPIKLKLDTVETNGLDGDFLRNGIKSTYVAKVNYAEESNMMLNINIRDNPIPEILLNKFSSDVNFNLEFVPTVGSEMSWDPQELSIKYEMDKLNFDWKINRPEINFIPGNIEIIIKEYPRVEINYTGKPIYVPASADPDYKPIDTFA
ncbi:hypothetical protein J2Z76_001622 [Sedimentibacter acidaminivorans]|uniref:MHD domain-containing protein n=1 Tax=Sedimentibacter acidaminivorans TaxID=913099 RepID=A0ABS4GDJ5_9FIRM|nr:DUF6470 family protein [Sedimentibacter acidaminivorans]MBP1925761.1 hypothetical protein [Sedimentibacter acidaminivorans]